MAKITQKELMSALEPAAVVVIGTPIVQWIPVVGSLLGKLPSWPVWETTIALPSIVAGAGALIIYGLVKAKMT